MHMPKVLLITGPGGSGKTTVSEMLSQRSGFEYLDGDKVDTEFFPDGGSVVRLVNDTGHLD